MFLFFQVNVKVGFLPLRCKKSPSCRNSAFFLFILFGFSVTYTNNSKDIRGREGTISFPLYHFLVFLIAAHVMSKLLLDEIYPPLVISIWLNVKRIFLVEFMLDHIGFSHTSGKFKLLSNLTWVLQTKPLSN